MVVFTIQKIEKSIEFYSSSSNEEQNKTNKNESVLHVIIKEQKLEYSLIFLNNLFSSHTVELICYIPLKNAPCTVHSLYSQRHTL